MGFRTPYLSQWFAAVNVFMLTTTIGISFGWMSPFLGNLSRPDSYYDVTKEQMSWIASLTSMGQPIGIILGSVMANSWGSKISTQASGFFFVSAWLLLVLAKTVHLVFASLTVLGISTGIANTILPIYMAEMSDSKIRGLLISFVVHGATIGVLVGNLLGVWLSPTTIGMINFVLVLVSLISFSFVPSTPLYLLSRKKVTEAENAVKWYNQDVDPAVEVKMISEFLESSPKLAFLKSARELMKPINFKALMIICMLHGFTQLFGVATIMAYSEVIFIESKVVLINPAILVTILNGLTIPIGWVSMYTIDTYGRIAMLLVSYALLCTALIVWSVHFFLLDMGFVEPQLQWFSIISAAVFRVGISIGVTPIATALVGELYAPNIKPIGCLLHNIFTAICFFVSSKNFQLLVDNLTYKYTFLLFAVFMFLIGLCVIIFVPETKGKTLQEIQEILSKRKKNKIPKKQTDIENDTNI